MKKTILTIILCGFMTLGLTGCKTIKNQFDIGNKSDIKISQSDVVMSIKDGTLTSKGAVLILTNNSDLNYKYGEPYEMEIKENGEWYKINVKLNFNLPAYVLKANEAEEIEIKWENDYGKLAPGNYRILKEIIQEKDDGTFDTFYVSVEFTIK